MNCQNNRKSNMYVEIESAGGTDSGGGGGGGGRGGGG
jgi:hypothetical protein